MGELVKETAGALPEEVGSEIARWRTRVGWSPEQLAAELKISVRQLMLLERGEWHALPSAVFVRGVLRRIAGWSGASADAWLVAVDTVFPANQVTLTPPSNADGALVGNRSIWQRPVVRLVAALVVGAALIVAYLHWFGVLDTAPNKEAMSVLPLAGMAAPQSESAHEGERRTGGQGSGLPAADERQGAAGQPALAAGVAVGGGEAQGAANGPEAVRLASTATGAAAQTPQPAPLSIPEKAPPPLPAGEGSATPPSAQPAENTAGLVVRATAGESWLRVTAADGQVVYEGVLRMGKERQFPAARAPYALHLGNAPALALFWEGAPLAVEAKGVARLQVPPPRKEQSR